VTTPCAQRGVIGMPRDSAAAAGASWCLSATPFAVKGPRTNPKAFLSHWVQSWTVIVTVTTVVATAVIPISQPSRRPAVGYLEQSGAPALDAPPRYADFERDLIRERTGEGRKRAMANGVNSNVRGSYQSTNVPRP